MHRDPSTTANKQGQLVNCSKAWITGHICALEMEKKHEASPISTNQNRGNTSETFKEPSILHHLASTAGVVQLRVVNPFLGRDKVVLVASVQTRHKNHAQLINLHPKRKFCKVLGKVTPLRQSIESRLKVKH